MISPDLARSRTDSLGSGISLSVFRQHRHLPSKNASHRRLTSAAVIPKLRAIRSTVSPRITRTTVTPGGRSDGLHRYPPRDFDVDEVFLILGCNACPLLRRPAMANRLPERLRSELASRSRCLERHAIRSGRLHDLRGTVILGFRAKDRPVSTDEVRADRLLRLRSSTVSS